MKLQRVANAGVLLQLDGVYILLDGLCSRIEPYLETPAHIVDEMFKNPPDLLAFTHGHSDHFGEALVSEFQKQNLRPILGPESLPLVTDHRTVQIGGVKITPIPGRHLGKSEPGLNHFSYLIEGSRRIFFAGDAAPLQWKGRELALDLLIAPYAYANTPAAWAWSKSVARHTVLVHLPERDCDPAGLWTQVETAAGEDIGKTLFIPAVDETVYI